MDWNSDDVFALKIRQKETSNYLSDHFTNFSINKII